MVMCKALRDAIKYDTSGSARRLVLDHINRATWFAIEGQHINVGMELAGTYDALNNAVGAGTWDMWMEFWDYVQDARDDPTVIEYLESLTQDIQVPICANYYGISGSYSNGRK